MINWIALMGNVMVCINECLVFAVFKKMHMFRVKIF